MPLEYMKVGPILVALSSKSRFVVVKVFIGWCYDGGGPEKKNLERCKKSWMRWDQRIGNLDLRRNGHHINWTGCCRQTELFIKFPPGFNQSGNSCTSSECGFCLAQSMLYHIHKAKGQKESALWGYVTICWKISETYRSSWSFSCRSVLSTIEQLSRNRFVLYPPSKI